MLEHNSPEIKTAISEAMTEQDFADYGMQNVVYVQEVSVEKAHDLFPEIDDLPEYSKLYAVHAANGTPVLLAEDLFSALEAIETNKLVVQQVH